MADTKKRLPVLKSTPEEESGEEPRPPWQWVGFGVGATFGACVPLQYAAEAVTQRLLANYIHGATDGQEIADAMAALTSMERAKVWIIVIGIRALPLVVGSIFGGYVVGRWGGDNAGVREAAISGVATAIIVTALAFAALGFGAWWTPALLLLMTTPASAWGGRIGIARRKKAMTPNMP